MNRRAFLTTTGAALAAAATPSGSGQPKDPDHRIDEVIALVRAKMSEYRVPGVGLGLLARRRGCTLHGFGVTSLDDPRPVTADTLFTIASISKTMTATAVMKLVEDGRAGPAARRCGSVLPEFRVRDEETSRAR